MLEADQAKLQAKADAEQRMRERQEMLAARHRARHRAGSAHGPAEDAPSQGEIEELCEAVFRFDARPNAHTFETLQALQGAQLALEPARAHVLAVLQAEQHPITQRLLLGRRALVKEHYSNRSTESSMLLDANAGASKLLEGTRDLLCELRTRLCDAYPDLLHPAPKADRDKEGNTSANAGADGTERRRGTLFAAVRTAAVWDGIRKRGAVLAVAACDARRTNGKVGPVKRDRQTRLLFAGDAGPALTFQL